MTNLRRGEGYTPDDSASAYGNPPTASARGGAEGIGNDPSSKAERSRAADGHATAPPPQVAGGNEVSQLRERAVDRDEVHDILRNWRAREWQVQGFGMLRTYLEGPGEPRLQVWDQRLATWSNNAIHDHPWAFDSTIYAGMLFNTRFDIKGELFGTLNGHVTQIIPGTRGGQLSERPVKPCFIEARPVEIYQLGDGYSQTHREMHLTKYAQGTVTLITRSERESEDIANIAWYGAADAQPPFVNPYPAPHDVTEQIINDALEAWWL